MNEKTNKLEPIKGTPFYIAEKENQFFAVMKNYRVTEFYDSKKEVEEYIKEKPWELLTAVIGIMVECIEDLKNIKNK